MTMFEFPQELRYMPRLFENLLKTAQKVIWETFCVCFPAFGHELRGV
jgi:hypothetical protein